MNDQLYIMPMTSKGQVTIPVAIRQLLGLQKSGKVAFKVEGQAVTVGLAQATLEAAYGAVEPLSRPEDFERLFEIAHEEQSLRSVQTQE